MEFEELSFTASAARTSQDGAAPAYKEWLPDDTWVQQLNAKCKEVQVVFSSSGDPQNMVSHVDVTLDHLFMSLLQAHLFKGMLVLYEPITDSGGESDSQPQQNLHMLLAFGVPVCGHPTIVHGGLISAIFDETFGALLFTAKALGHMESSKVFTARLEVDYKKPLPAESVIRCTAAVESIQGRKIWLAATLTDVGGETVYAHSRALFVSVKGITMLPAGQTTTATAEP